MADAHPDKSKSKTSKGLLKANNTANKATKKSKGRTSTKATSSASTLKEDGELFDTDDEMDQETHSFNQQDNGNNPAEEEKNDDEDDEEDDDEDHVSKAAEEALRSLPSLPGINSTTMTNVTAMFPGFGKAVSDARSVRDMIDHYAEKATCGPLDDLEEVEYDKTREEFIELTKTVKQCLANYKQFKALSNVMSSAPDGQNNPSIPTPSQTAGSESNVSNAGFTVFQQQLRDHPGTLTQVSPNEIKQFRRKWATALQQVPTLDRMVYIHDQAKDMITYMLSSAKVIPKGSGASTWAKISDEVLFDHLLRLSVPEGSNTSDTQEVRLAALFGEIRLNLDFASLNKGIQKFLQDLMAPFRKERLVNEGCFDTETTIPSKLRKELLKLVVNNFKKGEPFANRVYYEKVAEQILVDPAYANCTTTDSFMDICKGHLQAISAHALFNTSNSFVHNSNRMAGDGSKCSNSERKYNSKRSYEQITPRPSTHPVCDGCGKRHEGGRAKCTNRTHADYNSAGTWQESSIGKFLKSKGYDNLVYDKKRAGNDLVPYTRDNPNRNNRDNHARNDKGRNHGNFKPRQGTCALCTIQTTTVNSSYTSDAAFLHDKNRLSVKVLYDTGAETGSYVNKRAADWLKTHGAVVSSVPKYVCSCFGDCRVVSECIKFPLMFNDGVNNAKYSKFSITLLFWVIDKLPYDVVIGKQDINQNPILRNIKHHTQLHTKQGSKSNPNTTSGTTEIIPDNTTGSSCNQTCSQPAKVLKAGVSWTSVANGSADQNVTGAENSNKGKQPKPVVRSGTISHVSELLDYEPSANGIPEKWDSLDEYLTADNLMVVTEETCILPTKIHGDPKLQQDIRNLLVQYSDIFRTTVSPEPADIPPMEIKVNRVNWSNLKGTSGGPRVQSPAKNAEIKRQIDLMQKLRVIEESDSAKYCQVLLTPKPNDKWRFCIDYQPLNSCCEGEGWNLPNIHQMLQRLGGHRPKYFAVMDLTSGYHQAPLSLSSRMFTAFITFMGIFEWLRVPMGLKGAPSYFQKVLATVVLVGLMYTICELYIDDIIVHAREPTEFVERLRRVFERLRKHKITLNPEKCSFGLPSVEYVGHTIDETGLSFSPEKLDEVLAIPPPQYAKELRSFLGLGSYFRDHIQNLASIAKPLQNMLINYEKKKKLLWTNESEQAFLDIKEAIRRCPKLFFMNDDGPVFLHTDASDYGIGGYVFQIIDGKEYPIAFMSKTLSAEEMKWTTIEKECYAIVISLRKFEYLLRDRKFTLRTDHENLTYVNDPPSPKVRRWKIAIQEHDFLIEHIEGEKNIAADGFSRLLPITEETLCVLKEMRIPDDRYKTLSQFHNTNVGHHGVDRMLRQLRDQGHQWEYIREHVKKFIAKCPCCQKMSTIKAAIHTRPYSLSSAKPMEILHMDSLHMGIADEYNNQYVLVLIDSCSRWVELFPIPDLSAEVAAVKLVEHFGRFGQPAAIRSDNGTQFINELHDELYKLTGIERIRTIPHSHEENGLVERANREILRHVRSILFDRGIHKEWNLALPMVQRILNSQRSSSTGASPAELVLTNSISLDQGIYLTPTPAAPINETVSTWISKRLSLQQQVLLNAQNNLQAMENEKVIAAAGTPTEFPVDTYVLCSYPTDAISKGNVGKLKTPWKGPMLVVKASGDEYTLKDITTNKDYKVHISRIKPFYYDELRVDPFEIAAKDLDEEVIEKIVDHTVHRLKSRMDFKVRWLGYDDRHDLWLPWDKLRDNTLLHKYLFQNGMEKLIPREHRKLQY